MTKPRNNLKAGVFILISIALIVTVILSIKGMGRIFAPQQERLVSFKLSDDLGGLQVGDEVRLGGYKVGVVKDIEVRGEVKEVSTAAKAGTQPASRPTSAAEDPTRLIVAFTIPSRYALREDAVIGIQTTVTGTACLNISDLGTGKAADDGMVALVGKPSALNSLLANLGDISPELKPMVADARLAVADVRTKVVPELAGTLTDVRTKVVPEVGSTLTHYKGAGAHLEDLLGDTKGDIRGTIANLNQATATVKDKLPGTMDAASQFINRLDTTVKDAQVALEDVKVAIANFREVSESAKEVVGGNRGKLDGMIASLKTTADNLKAASVEIRHSPWRLLYKPGKGEMANLNLFDSARQFADGAGQLNDAALALRDAMQDKDVDQAELKELMQQLDESFTKFREVEEKLWVLVKE